MVVIAWRQTLPLAKTALPTDTALVTEPTKRAEDTDPTADSATLCESSESDRKRHCIAEAIDRGINVAEHG